MLKSNNETFVTFSKKENFCKRVQTTCIVLENNNNLNLSTKFSPLMFVSNTETLISISKSKVCSSRFVILWNSDVFPRTWKHIEELKMTKVHKNSVGIYCEEFLKCHYFSISINQKDFWNYGKRWKNEW